MIVASPPLALRSRRLLGRTATGGDTAVVYVADLDFLHPTLVSIASLRRFVPADRMEIFVFVLDQDQGFVDAVSRSVVHLSITLVRLAGRDLPGIDPGRWQRGHVPPASLGRFFINEALPTRVERVLYVDGDTLFVADPSALMGFDLPDGRFAAVEDSVSFCRNERNALGRETRAYLRGLGLRPQDDYFNAGVFLVGRRSWGAIAGEAFAFFTAHADKCLYHDQSALNAVVGDRRLRLSPIWNFQTRFRAWGAQREFPPRLLHFTQFPKPWMGAAGPWTDVTPTIAALSRDLAPAGLPVRRRSAAEIDAVVPRRGRLHRTLRSGLNYRILLRRWALRRSQTRAVM